MRFLWVLICASCVSACSTGQGTGDPLMDEVVKRENVDGQCIYVGPATDLVKFGSATDFKNEAVRKIAEKAAKLKGSPSTSDPTDANRAGCLMEVNRPVLYGEHAFVAFSNAGGEIGTYAFGREGTGWNVIERNVYAIW